MWSLSLRRLSSSSLLGSHGGFKSISYMPSRFAAFFTGRLDNGNSSSYSDNVAKGESEKRTLQSSGNFGTNMDLLAAKENVSAPYRKGFQNSAGLKDAEMGRNSGPMDFVRGILEQESSRFSQYNVEHNADIVHIKLMRNNSFINVTDSKGNTKFVVTSGSKKVVGEGKVTRYAAEATAEYAGRKAREMGLKSVVMKVEGFTYFRKKRQAIMSFREGFCNSRADRNPIVYIEDTTRRPHNGCRLPKKRRI
ncbi:hypothetical protein P3X46_005719 [Hevea brasiliensis]|uniref:Uncharacterized protein n=1 Tax=Hevea brasiliensis TaxID=3981 RepID=A0ABQ9N0V8_HEVBR|nr:probable ribosomal protein S11, mitochondrial [Hevea brasiliensis]KAJ9186187.1 hypothetical protein P3X46_005719 [Hevea brasiliensis]